MQQLALFDGAKQPTPPRKRMVVLPPPVQPLPPVNYIDTIAVLCNVSPQSIQNHKDRFTSIMDVRCMGIMYAIYQLRLNKAQVIQMFGYAGNNYSAIANAEQRHEQLMQQQPTYRRTYLKLCSQLDALLKH